MLRTRFVNSYCSKPTFRRFKTVGPSKAFFSAHHAVAPPVRAGKGKNLTSLNKNNKGKVVLASGVFDLLHLGHVRFLEEAKKAGGKDAKLIVIVARDSTVEKKKGKKPVMPEYQRCALVASLKVVDEAMLGYEGFSMARVLEKIRPDIVAVGYDSHTSGLEKAVEEAVKKKRWKTRIVKIGKFSSDELDSSSKIKQKIVEQIRR